MVQSNSKNRGKDAEPAGIYSDFRALRAVFLSLPSYRISLIVLLAMSTIEAVLGGASLSLLIPITQGIIGAESETSIMANFFPPYLKNNAPLGIVVFGIVFLSQSFFSVLRSYLTIMVAERLRLSLQKQMVRSALTLSMQEMIETPKGVLMENALKVSDAAAMFVLKVLTYVTQLLVLLGLLGALAIISWMSFLVLTAIATVAWLVIGKRYFGWSQFLGKERVKFGQSISGTLSASLSGIKEIKLSDREPFWADKIGGYIHQLFKLRVKSKLAISMPLQISQVFIGIALVCFGLYLFSSSANLATSLPLIIFLVSAIYRLFKQSIVVATSRFGAINLYYAFDLVCKKHEPTHGTVASKPSFKKPDEGPLLSIVDMTFTYNTDKADSVERDRGGRQQKIFNKFSFEIWPNEIVGLFGPSGSGKTTLIDLMAGLYSPSNGKILVGGQNLNDVDASSWRQHIGYVPQHPVLFRETIRENIALGRSHLTDDEILAACAQACVEDLIQGSPNGLDTIIEEHGANLSGGQLRRLALARAIVDKPDLIILDEAASSLEEGMEQNIIQNLRDSSEAAIIIVSHRAATKTWVDRLISLNPDGTMANSEISIK